MSDLILGNDWVRPVHRLPNEKFGGSYSGPSTVVGILSRQAAVRPLAPFLTTFVGESSETIGYARACMEVQLRASSLRMWGLKRGERVAILGKNSADFVFAVLAALEAGAVVVPLSPQDTAERLARRVEFTETRFLLYDDGASTLVDCCKTPERACTFCAFHREARAMFGISHPPTLPKPTDAALIFFTSGTTGTPKAVVQSHYAVAKNAFALSEHHRIKPGRCVLCVLPLSHVNGLEFTIFSVLLGGGQTVLCSGFDTLQFWKIVQANNIQVVSLVPNLLRLLAQRPRLSGICRQELDYAVSAAAPLSTATAETVLDHLGLRIVQGYGLSETTNFSCIMPTTLNTSEYGRWMFGGRRTSVGRALAGQEVAIQAEDGLASSGAEGEVLIRGHSVMSGYLHDSDSTTDSFRGDWFHTGDLGYYLESDEGHRYFHISGRLREIAKRSGAMVNLLELDEVLTSIPGVNDAGSAAFANNWVDEEICAVLAVGPSRSLSEQDALEYCRRLLPFSETPKAIRFVDEVPRNSAGKIQRRMIAEQFSHLSATHFVEHRSQGGSQKEDKKGL
jgi:acyl-CoA synthetase (AMP-forming)/AMP-acid ligase II